MDLICFSHLRWNFVYQRPQHLLTRFSYHGRVFYIEEPVFHPGDNYYSIEKDKDHPNVLVMVPVLREGLPLADHTGAVRDLVDSLIVNEHIKSYLCWYYSPMALAYSNHLTPKLTVYDCMDELSAFKFAPPELREREKELMLKAEVVFTGGRSLYEAKKHLHPNIYCFPSSIDREHFLLARTIEEEPGDQLSIPHPRLGFFGVIDERLDIALLDTLSDLHPDWHIILVGPVVKIDPGTLPRKDNIHYLGGKDYKDLPAYLAGWDIAILPFAKNESTRFTSPTKTPEYLAGGKPVISTSIQDVVNPYGNNGLLEIADTAREFVLAAENILNNKEEKFRLKKADTFLAKNSWNATWHEMAEIIDQAMAKKNRNITSNLNPKKKSYV